MPSVSAGSPGIADEVQGDQPQDPALSTPTEEVDDVPFAVPGGAVDDNAEDVPLAR